ncbi:unnamed protein product [Rotaria sordida]|uniref:Glycosyltransferase n=1 Tax=Rotaria sordida TaxID=392033 RepID=A0A818W423_9BILA|nr:unnamed protein product [Rotaria sordida]
MFLLAKQRKRSKFITVTCCLHTIILFLLIIFIIWKLPSYFILSSCVTSSALNLIHASFKDELIDEHLASYSLMYNNESRVCNRERPLNRAQERDFSAISKLLITLREQIVPYPNEYFHGRGIVLTVGQHQLKFAKVNLKMIEHSGTQLDIQIWYSFSQISEAIMMELLNNSAKLNLSICCFDTAQCKTRTETWQLDPAHVYKPGVNKLKKSFPFKPAAIISATFAEVLFLDCDAYITRDPIDLFLFDPMYLKFGALFFPDSYQSRQHPTVWNLFNTTCGEHEYELDSATILVDKKRVWNGLYMTKLMNDNHKLFYKYVTDGDKDTFRFGFRYMDTGSFDGIHFCGWTICKTDSLAQHIYVNHVHMFKHVGISYSPADLDYTRIALGDPNNNSFSFIQCRSIEISKVCFHIGRKPYPQFINNRCYSGGIQSEEFEYHQYTLDEPLLSQESKKNQILISKTNNLMPHFVDNLLKYIQ